MAKAHGHIPEYDEASPVHSTAGDLQEDPQVPSLR